MSREIQPRKITIPELSEETGFSQQKIGHLRKAGIIEFQIETLDGGNRKAYIADAQNIDILKRSHILNDRGRSLPESVRAVQNEMLFQNISQNVIDHLSLILAGGSSLKTFAKLLDHLSEAGLSEAEIEALQAGLGYEEQESSQTFLAFERASSKLLKLLFNSAILKHNPPEKD